MLHKVRIQQKTCFQFLTRRFQQEICNKFLLGFQFSSPIKKMYGGTRTLCWNVNWAAILVQLDWSEWTLTLQERFVIAGDGSWIKNNILEVRHPVLWWKHPALFHLISTRAFASLPAFIEFQTLCTMIDTSCAVSSQYEGRCVTSTFIAFITFKK